MRQIHKVLVANRGEIAVRILRTLDHLGIASVAVFSDADEDALHVRLADEAVRIGPAPSSESYLRIDRIVEAARRSGADAVHPGFGFLSERAELAEALRGAGIRFIGPTPEAMRAVGPKREAKEIARRAGVPVVPGYEGADQSTATLCEEARRIGLPVLIKASLGGGGRGMRLVRALDDLEAAIESARREAEAAFGDGTLLIERYIEDPRHVEFQILGDQHGAVVHLFERECSIQRRHQKIIEETPSPALSPVLRERMGRCAVAIGRAIGYESAGTVEFILAGGPDGSPADGPQFYFLEVNTRLQVEHPITERVTGLDLVELQIRIAEGEPLPFSQEDLMMRGAALECRLYAEDPAQGFLPQSGTLLDFHVPSHSWLRVDSGVETGSAISIHYDPLLAKLITHADTREGAVRRMIRALRGMSVQGLATNRDLLLRCLLHPEYQAGRIHTHFIEDHLAAVLAVDVDPEVSRLAMVAATLMACARRRGRAPLPALPLAYRNNPIAGQWVDYEVGRERHRVEYSPLPGGSFRVSIQDGAEEFRLIEHHPPSLTFEDGAGRRLRARVISCEDRHHVHIMDGAVVLRELPRFAEPAAAIPEGALVAPMPGRVVSIHAEQGQEIRRGQRLVVMEAMKMEHAIMAHADGLVSEVLVAVGEQVEAQQLLMVVH